MARFLFPLTFTSLLLSTLSLAAPQTNPGYPIHCPGTCNPTAGLNKCDITTSCINTGSAYHCACRAGYKASATDVSFRLPVPQYEFLVFVPEGVACDRVCDEGLEHGPEGLCGEVPEADGGCPV